MKTLREKLENRLKNIEWEKNFLNKTPKAKTLKFNGFDYDKIRLQIVILWENKYSYIYN